MTIELHMHKTVPVPPKVIPAVYRGHADRFSCRRCGSEISEAWWNYCPNCGQAIKHADTCGTMGWKKEAADKTFERLQDLYEEGKS